jgi:hypothetical protein
VAILGGLTTEELVEIQRTLWNLFPGAQHDYVPYLAELRRIDRMVYHGEQLQARIERLSGSERARWQRVVWRQCLKIAQMDSVIDAAECVALRDARHWLCMPKNCPCGFDARGEFLAN